MVHGRCATIVGMDDIAAPDEAEILGTAVTASPLAADAPVRIPVHRYISAGFAELEYERMWPRVWHVACTMQIGLHQPGLTHALSLWPPRCNSVPGVCRVERVGIEGLELGGLRDDDEPPPELTVKSRSCEDGVDGVEHDEQERPRRHDHREAHHGQAGDREP